MKILLVNKFYYLKGGSERHFFELKNVLEKNNHEVIIFSTDNKKNITTGKKEYFIKELKMSLGNFLNGFKLFYNTEAVRELKKIIVRERPDIAHLHNISHHFPPAIIKVLKKNNIPTVMTVHDYKLICPNYKLFNQGKICEKCQGGKFYRCALNRCVKDSYLGSSVMALEVYWAKWKKYYDCVDVFIAPSRFMQNKLIENGFTREKVRYIPNFLSEIDKTERGETGVDKKDNYILFFGRLSGEKGVADLIKAFSGIDDKSLILKIAGDGEDMESLKELSRKMGVEKRTEFLGYRLKKEINELVKNSKFTVIPSKWYENAPYSILESYAQKKAVVGSNLGGVPELIRDNETGAVFMAGNVKDIVEKIDSFLKDPARTSVMGERGFEFLRNNFNQTIYYNKLMHIYQELKNLKKIDKNGFKC